MMMIDIPQRLQKALVSIIMVVALPLTFYILLVEPLVPGLPLIDGDDVSASLGNRIIILIAISVYQVRFMITTNIFKSKTPLFQLAQLTRFPYTFDFLFCLGAFLVFPISMASFGNYLNREIELVDLGFLLIFFAGSILSFTSELQRFVWKRDPANKDKLFTGGLFRYSMHINYFGEALTIPSYFYLVFASAILSALLFVMQILEFVTVQIPIQDRYLKEKYRQNFERYSKRTNKLIPFVY